MAEAARERVQVAEHKRVQGGGRSAMVRPIFGAFFDMRIGGRTLSRLALIGVLAAALGLAACGRKGGLDLPPSAVDELKQDDAARADPKNVPRRANDPLPRRKPLPIDGILN